MGFEQLGWVLLGELAIVVVEAGLLRRFFNITVGEAYGAAIIANLVSFCLGSVAGLFLQAQADFLLMYGMSEIFWDMDGGSIFSSGLIVPEIDYWTRVVRLPQLPDLSAAFMATLTGSAILGLLAAIIEVPVYASRIRQNFEGGYQPNPLVLVLINLVSFPLVYSTLFIFGWVVAWLDYLKRIGG